MKRPSSHADQNPEAAPVWLITFNDMVTLLMVFFVLLFSMGTMDDRRFTYFQTAMQSAMGVMHEGAHAPDGLISEQQRSIDIADPDPSMLNSGVRDLQSLPRTEGLEAEYTRRGLELRLSDALLFSSGSAQLTPAGQLLLARISAVIGPLQRPIRVEGHTDDRPIATVRYPSNWELSTDRAVRVVKFFIDDGHIPAPFLSAAGYGSSRPRASNNSDTDRAANRRVEIILGSGKAAGPPDL
jgi:chemotaxis protein MotB